MQYFVKQFVSYSVVGIFGTSVHFALLAVLVQLLNLNPVVGSVVGFIAGGATNYLLNYHFTFQCDNKHLETSMKFFSVAITGLGFNTIIMYIATPFLHYLLSQAIATTTVLFWSFIFNRIWTFREAHLVKH